jgi:hypothetical protein
MHTMQRLTTIRLGGQVQRRERVTRRGRRLLEPVPAGETFAGLFPDLVGRELTFGSRAVEFAGQPRLLTAVQWLLTNYYL